jgi:SSS family solute:Na+ symporter
VIGSIVLMIAMILAYVIYRIIYARRLKMSS